MHKYSHQVKMTHTIIMLYTESAFRFFRSVLDETKRSFH